MAVCLFWSASGFVGIINDSVRGVIRLLKNCVWKVLMGPNLVLFLGEP